MSKRREVEMLVSDAARIPGALRWVEEMLRSGLAAGPVAIRLGRPRRTLDQNAKLWPMLTDIARQVPWVKDGERCLMSEWEWKDLFTASLRRQSMAKGLDGGMVVLGLHTSELRKDAFSDLIELMYAFGAERQVQWSERARAVGEANRQQREEVA